MKIDSTIEISLIKKNYEEPNEHSTASSYLQSSSSSSPTPRSFASATYASTIGLYPSEMSQEPTISSCLNNIAYKDGFLTFEEASKI